MTVNVTDWDVSEHLETEEDVAAYLNAVMEDEPPPHAYSAVLFEFQFAGMAKNPICRRFSSDGRRSAIFLVAFRQVRRPWLFTFGLWLR